MNIKFFILLLIFLKEVQCLQSQSLPLLKSIQLPKSAIQISVNPNSTEFAVVHANKQVHIFKIPDFSLKTVLDDKGEGDVCLAYSPDGNYLATGSWDKTIKLWDLSQEKIIKRYIGHEQAPRSVVFNKKGNILVSAGWDTNIKLWYVPTALNLKNFTGHNQCIRSLSFNSEGTKIVSGGYDQFIKLWDIASGKEIFSVKASAFPIEVLSFTPDDRYIITAGLENNVKIWDAENGKLVRILKGHTDAVYALTVSSDSRYLATGGNDNIIRIWEIQTGILLYQLKAHTQGIRSLVFSPDGRYLISGGVEGKIYIWNTEKLNIKPGVTQKELVYNNPMDINIATPLQNPYISSKRILPITFEIKNTDYNIVHLFLNKNEYTRFINNRKEVVKPLSVKVNYNKNIEINYEIYLDYDLSEIQLVAFKKNTDEFIISPELKVIYFDQEKYRNERKLLIVDLSAQKYQEKKWKTINEKIGVNKFVELMKYQQNKLFKDVSVKSFNENVSDSEIVHYLDSITIKLSNNDNVILLLNGIVLQDEQSGKYYYLLPKANLKSVEGSLLSIEFLLKFLLKTRSTAGMFINLSMRPDKIPPGFRLIDDEQLNSFVDKYLNTQKEIFYMSINNVQPVSISDMLANALHPDNDVDKNGIIDLSEISGFLNHLAKIQVIYRSNFIPFYSK